MEDDHELRARIQNQDESIQRLDRAIRQLEHEFARSNSRLDDMQFILARISRPLKRKISDRLKHIARTLAPPDTLRRIILKQARSHFRQMRGRRALAVASVNSVELKPQASAHGVREGTAATEFPSGHLRDHRVDSAHTIAQSPGSLTGTRSGGSSGGGRVLIIDHRLPSPDRDCGSLRMVEIIRIILDRGHHVTFIPDNFLVWPPYFEQLQSMGVEVVHPPGHNTVAEYLKQRGEDFDLAIISRAGIVAKHLGTVRWLAPRARVAFDTVDLHFIREQGEAELAKDPALYAAVARRRDQELGLASRSDVTIVVSSDEQEVLEQACPGIEVMVIPTIYPIDPGEPPPFEGRRDIIFIGGFAHAPNVDAVLYFVHQIFPRISAQIPELSFKVIGPEPPSEILALQSSRIDVLGFVPDVTPSFDRALVSVAPLRFGAGVKGKVNHSMALGVPSVVTSLAAKGMYLTHEQDAMICDDPTSFADAVVRVCRDPDLWRRLSANGRRSLKAHFSVEAATDSVDRLLTWAKLDRIVGEHAQRCGQ